MIGISCEREFISTLEWQILNFIARKAAKDKERFAAVSMAQLVKLTDCWDERFLDAAIGYLVTAELVEPAKQTTPEGGTRWGFICKSAKIVTRKHDEGANLTPADLTFLRECSISPSVEIAV